MWEVYEVNEVCVLKDGVQRVRYKTSPKATIKKTCKGSGVSKHGGAGSSRGRAWCLETIKPTTNTKQREWEEHAKGAQTKWKPHKSKTDGCKKNYEGASLSFVSHTITALTTNATTPCSTADRRDLDYCRGVIAVCGKHCQKSSCREVPLFPAIQI
ncbi:hypothetical protein DEO72_LG11g1348 [Vigna unguiculata]|uniref:Uncharacterized protein n=1 Tax=Vigna unguiculata TaxID=3917 RepID=A0A4D6NM13_VIGUN|nr:hypothetical protein DEO72_LG11g1348 [Vigna unguiculata]